MSRRRKPRDMTIYPGELDGGVGLGGLVGGEPIESPTVKTYEVDPGTAGVEAGAAVRKGSLIEQIEDRCDVVIRRILEEESEERVGLLKRELMGLAFAVVCVRQPFEGMVGPVAAQKWAKRRIKEVRAEWLAE